MVSQCLTPCPTPRVNVPKPSSAILAAIAESMASKTMAMIGAGGTVFGLAAWLFYYTVFAGVRGEDGMVFYSAVRAVLDGKPDLLYDGARLTVDLNARFDGFLPIPCRCILGCIRRIFFYCCCRLVFCRRFSPPSPLCWRVSR